MVNIPGRSRFFLAIIPPQPYYDEILKYKEYFLVQYQSKGALNSPPHITLYMPFLWPDKKEEILINALIKLSSDLFPVIIRFHGFGCFAPRVIFAEVENTPQFNGFQQLIFQFFKMELNSFHANYKDLPFHPHVTVAFRDLKKAAFHKAWKEFEHKPFVGEFVSAEISLLKHYGKKWEVFRRFPLAKI